MTKYIEFVKQNCFVVNISVLWLNQAVLTINNYQGAHQILKKISYSQKKNLFLQFSTTDVIKTQKKYLQNSVLFSKSASNFTENYIQVEVILFFKN